MESVRTSPEDDFLTKVGRSFVWQYYNIMNKCPECLYRFYTNFSILRHGSLEIAVGQKTIECRLEQLQYHNSAVKINQLQIYPALDNSIIVVVGGQLLREQNLLAFTQTFVLEHHSGTRYSILNDILTFDNYDGYARFINSKGVLQSVMVPIMQIPDGYNCNDQLMTETDSDVSDDDNSCEENNTENIYTQNPSMRYYPQENAYDLGESIMQINDDNVQISTADNTEQAVPYDFTESSEVPEISQAQFENLICQEEYMAEMAMPSSCFILPEQPNYCSDIISETDDSICCFSEPSGLHESNSDTDHCSCEEEFSAENSSVTQDKMDQLNNLMNLKTPVVESNKDEEIILKKTDELKQKLAEKVDQVQQESKIINISKVEKLNLRQPQQKPQRQVSAPIKLQPEVHLQFRYNKSSSNRPGELANKSTNSMQQKKIQPKTTSIVTTTSYKQENPLRNRRKRISDYYGDNHQLFLGNIPLQATEVEMRKLFEKFGKILELRILSNPPSKIDSKGRNLLNYGFLTFENPESVQKCLEISPFFYPNNLPNGHRINIERKKRRMGFSSNIANATTISNNLTKGTPKNGVLNTITIKNKPENRSQSSQNQCRSNSLHTVPTKRRR
ncbi:ras GTPase-activating protein-binding protein 2-like [Teleopsis dalmanni]|uniref:ras GTPase-activating protein-binding protein 2-like n=1 Tax=Teleopsis dalmanni TaxID=139649 RepID=UPI0018CCEFFD|nr:ras GTPase-activating protein-binding protein 2-like [Teleopsis dalmanni]